MLEDAGGKLDVLWLLIFPWDTERNLTLERSTGPLTIETPVIGRLTLGAGLSDCGGDDSVDVEGELVASGCTVSSAPAMFISVGEKEPDNREAL